MTTRFQLEAVLDLRRKKVDLLEQELAAERRAVAAQQVIIDRLRSAYAFHTDSLNAHQRGATLDLLAVQATQVYLEKLEREVQNERQVLAGLERQAEVKSAELAEALQSLKAVEKLKERAAERAAADERKRDQLDAEEIATTVYNFRRTA